MGCRSKMRAGRIDPHARDLLLLPHGNGLAWPLQDDDDVGGLLGRAAIGINDRAKEKQLRTGETIIYLHGALRYIRHQQIGRASCREGVCRYVKISVVAVSLKK